MTNDDLTDMLLTRAGMLMEDASARLIITGEESDVRIALLAKVVRELTSILESLSQPRIG